MPPEERFPPDDPREWLRFARADLALAEARVSGVDMELFAFHAQQAAEKAVKAVLIRRDVEFPYTHNLNRLLRLASDAGVQIPPEVDEAKALSVYAVTTRYPSPPDEQMEEQELADALRIAETVLRWAEREIG
ncbi:HEPN domain-containing protein [soil metagenome]|jgi:HEPN domain-containing protein